VKRHDWRVGALGAALILGLLAGYGLRLLVVAYL
jgi:hypothetical protein